ncbi:hypothetical protein CHUAL_013338 [Chamberlinius hualienensis]
MKSSNVLCVLTILMATALAQTQNSEMFPEPFASLINAFITWLTEFLQVPEDTLHWIFQLLSKEPQEIINYLSDMINSGTPTPLSTNRTTSPS